MSTLPGDDSERREPQEGDQSFEFAYRAPQTLAERIQKYYLRPDPGGLPELFAECWEAGLFRFANNRPNPITVTFFAAALDATGEAGWEGFLDDMLAAPPPAPKKGFLARLLHKAPTHQDRLNTLALIAFLSRDKEQRAFRYFLRHTLPPDPDLEPYLQEAEATLAPMRPKPDLDNPLQVDQLWAFFFATGDEGAVRKVIAVANGQFVTPPEKLQDSAFTYEAIMQGAAVSLVELAVRQPRVCQIIYAALDDYRNTPVYPVLVMCLERAGVARVSQQPDGSLDIKFQLPPDWQ